MSYALDFAKLKTETPILDVLAMLGIEHLTNRGDTLRGCCPLCKAEDARAFIVTPAKNTWYCFKEKSGGDIIRLVAKARDLKDREAAEFIDQHFNGTGKDDDNAPPRQEVSTGRKPSTFDPLTYLASLSTEHEVLANLDVLPETLVQFKAGFSNKGTNRGRLAVACHDLTGTIEMFIGIALNGELPRYLAPKGQELPYFFNLHNVEENEELRILPHVIDVMQAVENGATNVICSLREVGYLSLSALAAFVKSKKLTVVF